MTTMRSTISIYLNPANKRKAPTNLNGARNLPRTRVNTRGLSTDLMNKSKSFPIQKNPYPKKRTF